jgi:hypothetical protein
VLQAGAASGVTLGSVWELYEGPTEDSKPIGSLRARSPRISTTLLENEDEESISWLETILEAKQLYARQVRVGIGHELKVYFTPEARVSLSHESMDTNPGESKYGALCDSGSANAEMLGYQIEPENTTGWLQDSNEGEVGYVIHPNRESAEIVVAFDRKGSNGSESEVVFTLYNPHVQAYAPSALETRIPLQWTAVQKRLLAAARWNWHLKRANMSSPHSSKLSLEFMKLGETHSGLFEPVAGPWQNLNKMGVVDIQPRPQDKYGIKLVSGFSAPLYVRVFYFEVSDFSISGYLTVVSCPSYS